MSLSRNIAWGNVWDDIKIKIYIVTMVLLQLMAVGVSRSGQSALLLVEEEPRPGPERVLTLPPPLGDQNVREKALRLRLAIQNPVQVM